MWALSSGLPTEMEAERLAQKLTLAGPSLQFPAHPLDLMVDPLLEQEDFLGF